MDRRQSIKWLFGLSALPVAASWAIDKTDATAPKAGTGMALVKSNAEWAKLLPADAYHVLFEEGTERSGTSPLDRENRDGTFVCAACSQPLFDSTKKYDSGTGWPSFWQPLAGAVETKTDFKMIYPRTEYHCSRCGGHQGHIFSDGPPPTGKRYCNNGVALRFIPRAEKLPVLRT